MSEPKEPRTSSSPALRWSAAVLALGAALIAGSFFLPSASGDSDSADRKAVISAVSDFAVTYNTYDATDLADYQARVGDLLTPEYNDEFTQVTEAFFTVLNEKKQVSKDASIKSVAVESIDGDSAEALVAVDATITNSDVADQAGIDRRFRWRVSLVKDGESWKISNFESIAAVEATTGPTDQSTEGSDGQ